MWFGWGQAAAPSWLVIPLAVGTALGALLTVTGVVVTKRSAGPLPVMTDPAVRRRYSIIVGLERGLLGAGAAALGAVAVAALVVGLASAVAPFTVTGLGAGLCLLAFGLATLLIGGPRPGSPGPPA